MIALAQVWICALLARHLQGFRMVGRRRISKEVWDLIFRMIGENPTWGAPRIHGELLSEHKVLQKKVPAATKKAQKRVEPGQKQVEHGSEL